ncbi:MULTISPECIES: LuxR C-terminal-related transcriptional regulator [Microbacterium]|uniref:helix-turn-helix transcriptional regulator n=1 Tax=Microbacterium TaxID=33882 RepID=UPI000D650510|nr:MULTISPECIES: LuxR C-terminal-related transcriptional regulator [Microbacterium]
MQGDAVARHVADVCHAVVDGHDAIPDALALVSRLVGSEFASFSDISLARPHESVVTEHGRAPLSADEYGEWARLLPTHPYALHVATAATPAPRLTDVVDLREFAATEVFQVCLEPTGARYQAAMRVTRSPAGLALVSLWRSSRDFTEDELVPAATVVQALRHALQMRALLDRLSAAVLADDGRESHDSDAMRRELTARQAEVIALVARGHTNQQIALRLGISPRTVRKHVEDLFWRTGARSRTELAVLWTAPARRGNAVTASDR